MVPTGDMFQRKYMSFSRGCKMCLVLGMTSSLQGFDNMGRDHDATLDNVLRICKQSNLKLNKDKSYSGVQAYHS